MNKRIKAILFILCIALTGTILFNKINNTNNTEVKEASFEEFKTMLEDDEIEKVEFIASATKLTFIGKDEITYQTENPRNEGFKRELMDAGITVEEIQPSSMGIYDYLTIGLNLISVCFIGLMVSQIRHTSNNDSIKSFPDVSLDDVIGPEEMKEDVRTLIQYIKNPEPFNKNGVKMPKGVIFYGEPGTGKTLLAKAIAGEAKIPFYSKSGSDFVELFAGNGARKVRALFKEARKNKPCIIFIDEIDAVGKKRGMDSNGERDQTMNQLLAEIDGFESETGILLIAATNRLEDLDPALIRSGRFDKHIHVPLPMTKEDRIKIIQLHTKNMKMNNDVDFEKIAQMTIGLSGADIQSIMNEAALIATCKERNEIVKEDIDEAFTKKILKGHANKKANLEKDYDELQLIAYHEAGHTLLSKLLNKKSVPMVSIVGTTTGAGGFTLSTPEKMSIMTKEELYNEVKELYAGRAAEEIMGFGQTTGASNDISKATGIISNILNIYGLNESNGLLSFGECEVSDALRYQLDKEAINLSKSLYEETKLFIIEHKELLEKLCKELIKKEVLEEKEIDEIILSMDRDYEEK